MVFRWLSSVLKLCIPTSGSMSLIPSWGTKILYAMQCHQKKKKKEN